MTDKRDQVWFAVNALRGRNFDDIAIGDRGPVDYAVAQQDSHSLRATHVRWPE